jgi:hypothetical protein
VVKDDFKIMVAVFGFFSHQVDDLSDAYSHQSGWIVVFRKVLPAKFHA